MVTVEYMRKSYEERLARLEEDGLMNGVSRDKVA